jgi:hypothetical protein
MSLNQRQTVIQGMQQIDTKVKNFIKDYGNASNEVSTDFYDLLNNMVTLSINGLDKMLQTPNIAWTTKIWNNFVQSSKFFYKIAESVITTATDINNPLIKGMWVTMFFGGLFYFGTASLGLSENVQDTMSKKYFRNYSNE